MHTVDHKFRSMIKSGSYAKHFRYQSTTLIKVYRQLRTSVQITEPEEYESFLKFAVVADQALQAVTGDDEPPDRNRGNRELVQKKLDEAMLDLQEYCQTLSGFGDYDPIALMLDARNKDQERNHKIVAVDKLKKIPEIKNGIEFYIHDGSKHFQRIQLNISKKSGSEEILFKLGRKLTPPIKLHENAYFYTGQAFLWNKSVLRIKLVSEPSTFHPKQVLDFKDYFNSMPRGPVHVFVDRDPSMQILITTKSWSRLVSLAGSFDNETVIVLKDVDGTLYDAQQVVHQLNQSNARIGHCRIYRFDRKSRMQRTAANLTRPDFIGILCEARKYIVAEDMRGLGSEWLIEIALSSHTGEPPFVPRGSERTLSYTHRRPMVELTGGMSQGLIKDNATTRLQEMIERFELEKNKAERLQLDKNKKGFFGKVFGKQ